MNIESFSVFMFMLIMSLIFIHILLINSINVMNYYLVTYTALNPVSKKIEENNKILATKKIMFSFNEFKNNIHEHDKLTNVKISSVYKFKDRDEYKDYLG